MSVAQSLLNLVSSLHAGGLNAVYIAPGSRNAPVIRAFLAMQGINCYSASDERSAAFMAMGHSLATREPVAVVCTSGTALLNFYPAITEAYYSGIPLLVISADRPAKLIDQWEGQCIRQMDVFDKHIGPSLQFDPLLPETTGSAVNGVLNGLKKGLPVHLNIPLNEPLYVDEATTLPVIQKGEFVADLGDMNMPEDLQRDITYAEAVLLLNGTSLYKMHIDAGPVVVLNDVVSNKWNTSGMSDWDLMFFGDHADFPAPDLLLTTGTSIISKSCRNWLRSLKGLKQWHIGTQNPVGDPFFKQPSIWPCHESLALPQILKLTASKSHQYKNSWESLYTQFRTHLDKIEFQEFSELSVLKYVFQKLPNDIVFHFANSSVVRYASWLGVNQGNRYVYANRGTSGIDGCSSTAVGFARATEKITFLITGDVAFFYDINALFCSGSLPANLRILLINNGGGGIFNLLDGPGKFENSLTFQTTPHFRNASHICADAGLAYFYADNPESLKNGTESIIQSGAAALFEVKTDALANAEWFRALKNSISNQL